MRRAVYLCAATAALLLGLVTNASAHPTATQLSGAIFTTDAGGVPVNLNLYAAKQDVHLNGGPGMSAPDDAAGLPSGIYSFQVTDPSGKTLLSTDPVACRQVEVGADGVFGSVAPSGACAHATGSDGEDGGTTVQLFPFDDTPNNGGVYKVWLSPTAELDCDAPGNKHCFVPHHSKTDNFKVRNDVPVEIDTRFTKDGVEGYIDGLMVTWTDTLGASNVKYSEYNPAILAFHEAHVEAAEPGRHVITITDQPGCTIDQVHGPDGTVHTPVGGSVSVPVTVARNPQKSATYFVDVHCAA